MKSFLLHYFITLIAWLPGFLAVIGAIEDWNFFIVFVLIVGQAGLIATIVAVLAEVAKRVPESSLYSGKK